MTNEEAIYCMMSYLPDDRIEHCINCPYYGCNKIDEQISLCKSSEAHRMAIKALEQQPCEDVISRKAVFNAIEQEDKWLLSAKGHNGLTEIAFSGLKARVDALPSVTQKSAESEDKTE